MMADMFLIVKLVDDDSTFIKRRIPANDERQVKQLLDDLGHMGVKLPKGGWLD